MKFVLIFFVILGSASALLFKYHTNEEINQYLSNYVQRFPNISAVYNIGTSVNGIKLNVVKVTKSNGKFAPANVKLVGNIHGNEAIGREILLQFLEFLGTSQEDPSVNWLLENTIVHILPSLNPDGFVKSQQGECHYNNERANTHGVDLNRDFSTVKQPKKVGQPETESVKRWLEKTQFVLSAGLHSGALVVNYPYDWENETNWKLFLGSVLKTNNSSLIKNLRDEYIASYVSNPPSITPDDDVFKHLAKIYATAHKTMLHGDFCTDNKRFVDGITNGAAWYAIDGGMQDYNYMFAGCMELTLELSCCKYPLANRLPELWEQNKQALLSFLIQANTGVKGLITDKITKSVVSFAKLQIAGRNMEFKSDSHGNFWRILLPGDYKLLITHENKTHSVEFSVLPNNETFPKPTELKIELSEALIENNAPRGPRQTKNNTTEHPKSTSLKAENFEITKTNEFNVTTEVNLLNNSILELINRNSGSITNISFKSGAVIHLVKWNIILIGTLWEVIKTYILFI